MTQNGLNGHNHKQVINLSQETIIKEILSQANEHSKPQKNVLNKITPSNLIPKQNAGNYMLLIF